MFEQQKCGPIFHETSETQLCFGWFFTWLPHPGAVLQELQPAAAVQWLPVLDWNLVVFMLSPSEITDNTADWHFFSWKTVSVTLYCIYYVGNLSMA